MEEAVGERADEEAVAKSAEESVEECARMTTGKENLKDKGKERDLSLKRLPTNALLKMNEPLNRLLLLEDKLAPTTGAQSVDRMCAHQRTRDVARHLRKRA